MSAPAPLISITWKGQQSSRNAVPRHPRLSEIRAQLELYRTTAPRGFRHAFPFLINPDLCGPCIRPFLILISVGLAFGHFGVISTPGTTRRPVRFSTAGLTKEW